MRVAVIGAGIMGSGIAQITAMHGHEVALVDRGDAELERGLAAVKVSLARFRKAERLTGEESDATLARIAPTTSIAEAVGGADVAVEAVPEILELKHEVLRAAAAAAPSGAIFATNTSQLSITKVASALEGDAARAIGAHFFNPPVLMPLVEVVKGEQTDDVTVQRACGYAESIGKQVVVCRRDLPGFITTRAYAALRLECIRMLEDGVASAEDIDKALRLGFNFPMGPLELGDFNGLDTFFHIATSLEAAYGERFHPPDSLRELFESGRLGRKSGEGFYRYDEGGRRLP